DDRDVGIFHRPQEAVRLRLTRKVEERMDGGHDDIKTRKGRVRKVQRSVLQDVELYALEDREALELGVDSVNLARLARDASGIEPMRHGHSAAVIGQRDIFVTAS